MLRKPNLVAIALITCAGCGGTQAPAAATPVAPIEEPVERSTPVRERGGKKLIAEIGSAGGTLELANGARLEIPQGALAETVEVTFSEGAHTTAFSNHEYERAVGPTLEISPPLEPGRPFVVSVPATRLPEGFEAADLTMALEVPADAQRAVQMHGVQTRWDYLPARSDAGRVVGELAKVPGYRVQFVVSRDD